MKNITIQIISMIVLAISVGVVSANAQSGGSYRAQIPFDFTAGNVSFKAGSYMIGLANPYAVGSAVIISDTNGKNARAVMSMPGNANWNGARATLTFSKRGEQYSLAQMMTQTLNIRFRIIDSDPQPARKDPSQVATVLIRKN